MQCGIISCAGRPHWKLLTVIDGCHERTVFSVDWSCGGFIATGSGDNAIRVFDVISSPDAHDGHTSERNVDAVDQLTDDSTVASKGSMNGTAAAPDVALLAKRSAAHEGDVNCVRWHPSDGTLLASAGDDGCVCLWRLAE